MFSVDWSRSAKSAVKRSEGANSPPTCFTVIPLPDCAAARWMRIAAAREFCRRLDVRPAPWRSRRTSSLPDPVEPADRLPPPLQKPPTVHPSLRTEGAAIAEAERRWRFPARPSSCTSGRDRRRRQVCSSAESPSASGAPLFNRRARRVHADLAVKAPQNVCRASGPRTRPRRLVHCIHHALRHKLVEVALHVCL